MSARTQTELELERVLRCHDYTSEDFERARLRVILDDHCWNRTRTAAYLKINRSSLYRRMKKLGLVAPRATK